MAASSDVPPRQLFLVLGSAAVATLAVVGILLFRTRSTVVEIEAELERFELTLVPPGLPETRAPAAPAALQKIDFLAPSLRTERLDLKGVQRIEAFVDGTGRSTLRPGAEDVVRLAAGEAFLPILSAFGKTRLSLETAGRDRAGHRALRLSLTGEEDAPEAWSGTVPASYGLDLELRGSGSGETTRATISPAAPDVTVAGGRTEGIVGLTLPALDTPGTLLRVVDPITGEVTERRLPFATSEARALAWGDRLAILEPAAGTTGPEPLLRPDLKIARPHFFRTDRFDQDSFILGGKVRFPGGEKADLDLEPRILLSLRSSEPFTLRSVALREGRISVLLWGRATSLRLGPTPELQGEELPSLFVWLYTHRLRTLVYSTVASVLGLCAAGIKTFGLFKDKSS